MSNASCKSRKEPDLTELLEVSKASFGEESEASHLL